MLPRSSCQPSSYLKPPVERIRHGTVAEMIGHLWSQPLGLGGKVRRLSSVICLPELHRFSELSAQTIAEAATFPGGIDLHHLTDRALHVGQTISAASHRTEPENRRNWASIRVPWNPP